MSDGWSRIERAIVGTTNSRVTCSASIRRRTSPGRNAAAARVRRRAGHVVGRPPSVDMEQRDGVDHDVVARPPTRQGVVHRVEIQAAVREQRTFRRAGRAGRVEELGRRVLVDVRHGPRPDGCAASICLVLVAEHHLSHGCSGSAWSGCRNNTTASLSSSTKRVSARGEADVQRQEHGTGEQHAVIRLEHLVRVAAQPCDPIAGPDSDVVCEHDARRSQRCANSE